MNGNFKYIERFNVLYQELAKLSKNAFRNKLNYFFLKNYNPINVIIPFTTNKAKSTSKQRLFDYKLSEFL
jgi:hypothetical protein